MMTGEFEKSADDSEAFLVAQLVSQARASDFFEADFRFRRPRRWKKKVETTVGVVATANDGVLKPAVMRKQPLV